LSGIIALPFLIDLPINQEKTMSLTLHPNELASLVTHVLGKAAVDVVEWHCNPLGGAGGSIFAGGKGLYRVAGVAQDGEAVYPWSMVLKIASDASQTASHDPSSRFYWRREADAYQSDVFANLAGGNLVAPRCWAVEARSGNEAWIWLEDVQSTTDTWSLERYARSARHLGQFNGAYLAGYPLPTAQPWMTYGRTRAWVSDVREYVPKIHELTTSPLAQRWFGQDGVERLLHLWSIHEHLLEAFDRLPICFAHLDAYYRNLMERTRADGSAETVAIDWAYIGFGRVGEDAGILMSNGLDLLNVVGNQAKELDAQVFGAYLAGLQDAGWQGDARLARLGYTVPASLGTVLCSFYWLVAMQDAEGLAFLDSFFEYPLEAMIDQWRVTLPFFLDLGDEALALVATAG
jgi:hypothetical protein